MGTDDSQRAALVFQALSIAFYFCTIVAKSAKYATAVDGVEDSFDRAIGAER